jgi:hypothetical protein
MLPGQLSQMITSGAGLPYFLLSCVSFYSSVARSSQNPKRPLARSCFHF